MASGSYTGPIHLPLQNGHMGMQQPSGHQPVVQQLLGEITASTLMLLPKLQALPSGPLNIQWNQEVSQLQMPRAAMPLGTCSAPCHVHRCQTSQFPTLIPFTREEPFICGIVQLADIRILSIALLIEHLSRVPRCPPSPRAPSKLSEYMLETFASELKDNPCMPLACMCTLQNATIQLIRLLCQSLSPFVVLLLDESIPAARHPQTCHHPHAAAAWFRCSGSQKLLLQMQVACIGRHRFL